MKGQRRPVRTKEVMAFAATYLSFTILYHITLWIYTGSAERWFALNEILNWGGMDHLLKLLLGLPIWWLIFRVMWDLPLYQRLLVHVVTLPIFVFCWQHAYYLITDDLKMYHHNGPKQVWDVYISTLFYMLQFGLLHAYSYFRENQENIQRHAILQQAIIGTELSVLKAQLNPHFLYNVFNTINASIPAEQERTRQMIAELSDLFRYQLKASKHETLPLRDELAFTEKYLDLEKARFEERLVTEIIVDKTLLNEPIPPLILQPIVENAVKHGISPQINGGKITITIDGRPGHICFSITDTGPGVTDLSALLNSGIGLTNTELRLNKMYGSSLQFSDNQPKGLNVKFVIA